jgi:hypothetical protein
MHSGVNLAQSNIFCMECSTTGQSSDVAWAGFMLAFWVPARQIQRAICIVVLSLHVMWSRKGMFYCTHLPLEFPPRHMEIRHSAGTFSFLMTKCSSLASGWMNGYGAKLRALIRIRVKPRWRKSYTHKMKGFN